VPAQPASGKAANGDFSRSGSLHAKYDDRHFAQVLRRLVPALPVRAASRVEQGPEATDCSARLCPTPQPTVASADQRPSPAAWNVTWTSHPVMRISFVSFDIYQTPPLLVETGRHEAQVQGNPAIGNRTLGGPPGCRGTLSEPSMDETEGVMCLRDDVRRMHDRRSFLGPNPADAGGA
jgi:hypothetical protein